MAKTEKGRGNGVLVSEYKIK